MVDDAVTVVVYGPGWWFRMMVAPGIDLIRGLPYRFYSSSTGPW